MNTGYIQLSYLDLVVASVFLVLNGVLSIWLRLGLEKKLAVAAVRMTVQLFLVGLVLKGLFSLESLWLTLGVMLVMGLAAGREILSRQEERLAGWWAYGLGTGPVIFAGMMVTIFALSTHIGPDPWYSPRYAIPLLGMILGNAMTGISLGMNTLSTSASRERVAIEAQLLLGASRWEAMRFVVRRSLVSGFMPVINSMAATGIVSLPGMMTGQIMAGVDPTEAVKYQVLVMFLIGGATGLGVLLAVYAAVWRLTDVRHRLRLDRLAG